MTSKSRKYLDRQFGCKSLSQSHRTGNRQKAKTWPKRSWTVEPTSDENRAKVRSKNKFDELVERSPLRSLLRYTCRPFSAPAMWLAFSCDSFWWDFKNVSQTRNKTENSSCFVLGASSLCAVASKSNQLAEFKATGKLTRLQNRWKCCVGELNYFVYVFISFTTNTRRKRFEPGRLFTHVIHPC